MSHLSRCAPCALIGAAVIAASTAAALAAPTSTAAPAAAAAEPAALPAHNDYAKPDAWLCRPGHNAACDADLDTTVVAADGKTTVEKLAAAKPPAIDCFYVYPTVSREPGLVASMNVAPEMVSVVAHQFARFRQVCRPFAPVYRQFTLASIPARMAGKPMELGNIDPHINYNDVVDAWNYYLAHDNKGRGVVLVGHSQGSGILLQLVKNEIEGKPIQKQLVSAILMGTRLQVAAGKDVGGDFSSVPLCHSASQTGCAIAFASFRATAPPPPTSLFGKSGGPGLEAACVNPAALAGGSGPVHAYFGTINTRGPSIDWAKGTKIATPFVSVPGLLTAQCEKNDVGSYLAVTLHGDASGARTAEVAGDVNVGGSVRPEWGLHLIDANLFIGNLVDIVRAETAAYLHQKH